MYQVAAKTAFLQADVEERSSVTKAQPEGNEKKDNNNEDLVCCLHKYLYNLRRFPETERGGSTRALSAMSLGPVTQ